MKDVKAPHDQYEVHARIEGASLLQRNGAHVQTEQTQPFRNGSRRDNQEPDERNPECTANVGFFPNVTSEKKDDKSDC